MVGGRVLSPGMGIVPFPNPHSIWGGKYGVSLDGNRLTNLRFADDVVLLTRKPGDLQTMLQALSNSSRKT